MSHLVEQRVCLKFCFSNKISCAEALKMLAVAYGDSTISKTQAYEWYKKLKDGRTVVDDLPRSGRPSTSVTDENVEKVKEIVHENRRVSIREIVADIRVSFGSVHSVMNDVLGMRRIEARLVPRMLNVLQKEHRIAVAKEMLSLGQNVIEGIITGDETWVYEYDIETNQQSSEWRFSNEPKPKKPRQSRSKIKILMTVFFDCRGVVHFEFLPPGLTVNKEYYVSVLKRLRENVRRKRPELWRNNSWFLHHDNAPVHTSHIVRDYLTKNNINTVPQAPYSPDMAPCDFFLFPRLKLPLRGKHFETIEAIKENSQKELKAIPKSAYKKCFEDWKTRWHMCIACDGDYFEGNKINIDE
ncbi:Mariner Mos1 transposase [Anthophora retusa]